MPVIVLVRHGETEWSRTGRHTGRTDVDLTPAGAAEARALGGRLGGYTFGTVLTSPLRRAADTCRLAGLSDHAEPVDELVEWDYGAYEGLTTAEIRQRQPDWSLWRDGAPGGEHADAVAARLAPVLRRLRRARHDVAVFSHGHLLRVLAARWLGLPAADGGLFALSTAAVSRLGREHGAEVILGWNETAHGASGTTA